MSLESPSPASSPNIVTPASAAGKRERRAPSHFGSVTSYPSDLAEQFVDFEALVRSFWSQTDIVALCRAAKEDFISWARLQDLQ